MLLRFAQDADGPELAIQAGTTSVIQPGGSKRDAEVIEACESAGVAMVFTKHRHFRTLKLLLSSPPPTVFFHSVL
jgi:hypothetical protein